MASQTIENYLKALYKLSLHSEEISTTDIAHHMDVTLPTVNSMVKKLSDLDFIIYKKYKPLIMSDLGRKEAALIIRKHRLTEMYLVEKMGFGWEEVHEIAEQIEHIKSPYFFNRIDDILGYPKYDPHGSPIPDKNGNVEIQYYKKLSQYNTGEKVYLRALVDTSDEFLKYLNDKQLSLGSLICIVNKNAFDKSMKVSYNNREHELLPEVISQKLLVET